MIIVKVGQPKTKNLGDVWFDPTTKVSQQAQPDPYVIVPNIGIIWVPMQPSNPYPLNPNIGDVHVDMTGVPATWDGICWSPAIPPNYTYPPFNPSTGITWTEPLSQTPYIFFNGVWCELAAVSALQAVQGAPAPTTINVNVSRNAAPPPTPPGVASAQSSVYNQVQIIGPSGPLVTIDTALGTLTYGPGYTPDAAAQIFWRTMAGTSPRFMQTRIDELTKDLKDATSRLAVAEGNVLKFTQAGYKLPEPPKPFDPNDSWDHAMGIIK